MRIAFYGGSFDPPHVAHVLATTYLLGLGEFDRVLVVPVYAHAFQKALSPFADRVTMCELAMGWIPGVEVSGVEADLETPSLTFRTLSHLQREHPDWGLRLVVGSDVLGEVTKWHAFAQVRRLAPPFVLGRVGYPSDEAGPPVLPEISSTQVRELLRRRGEAPADGQLAALVPARVLAHIDARGLYR
jgi:nicotinate-nucleotide adenylyltransferase